MRTAVRRFVVLAMLAAACSGASVASPPQGPAPETQETTGATPESSSTIPATEASPPVIAGEPCHVGAGVPFATSTTAKATPLIDDGPIRVEAVVYPHPEYEGNPWSQWGQGIVVEDGRFYSAIGDHYGLDGNSYLYEYDPQTGLLTLIADVLDITGQASGSWGYGKIHAQMVAGRCGIYVATYWGTRRRLVFDQTYQGDRLLHVDPAARTIVDLSVIMPEHGVPSLASSPEHDLIYAEAVDPFQDPNTGWFVVLDGSGNEVFRTDQAHVGFRAMAVDGQGRALFSAGNGELAVYDPDANEVTGTISGLPGQWLRAATSPAPDGTIYGVTREPDALFALDAAGTVRDLGLVQGYTTSLALSPDGSTVYYVPFAHGGSFQSGTPLVSVDTARGDETVLLTLNDAAEEKLGLTLGGSYDVAMSPDGATLYIGMNADVVGARDTFGSVVLLIVHLEP